MLNIIVTPAPVPSPRHRRRLKPFYRLTLTILASIAAVRVILFAIDIAASRSGLPGGEITLLAYIAIFICRLGRGWRFQQGSQTRRLR